MQFLDENRSKLQSISEFYFAEVQKSNHLRDMEREYTVKIQACHRKYVLRKKYLQIRMSTVYIQKVARGYLARMLMKRNNDTRSNERNLRYYNHQATVIQRYFRGYYYRKYSINFSVRKQFLLFLKSKNETFQRELNRVATQEYQDLRVREELLAKTEFERLASNLHHLSSTKIQPGVYNKPYGSKDIVFDMDVESHLKVIEQDTVQQVYELLQKIKTNIMIFLLLSTAIAIQLNNELVHIAIDCGSDQPHQAPEGFTYKEDQYFFGSSRTADYTYNEAALDGIKYTLNSRPYLTERHGETFGYKIPITDGEYTIILQFVELYFTNENHRQFDISIGKRRILQNFAILDGKPKAAANDIYINVQIKDSQVFYKEAPCDQGYEDGKIVLRFERGAADLPKIDALIIVRGNQADQVERQELIDNWENRVKEQQEKQKKAQLQDIDKTQNIEPLADSDLPVEPEESLFAFLLSPLGLGIALVLALVLVCLRLTDTKKTGKQKRLKKPNMRQE